MRPLMITDLADATRPCLNPQSVLWPRWPEEVQVQQTARSQRWAKDQPVVILNRRD